MITEWPVELSQFDFTRVRFSLEFLSPCTLHPVSTLGLRRALRTASKRAFAQDDSDARERVQQLLDPSLSFDPVAVRRFQKPAPPFVLSPLTDRQVTLDIGDHLPLDVLIIGTAIPLINDFLQILNALGALGLVQGEGSFEVSMVESVSLDGQTQTLWRQQGPAKLLAPEIVSAEAYLQYNLAAQSPLLLQFITPTRLLKSGKVLKSPRFHELFPFMLRRVTSMMHAHCQLELLDEPRELIEASRQVDVTSSDWAWQDWRIIGIEDHQESIGGFVGEIVLSGESCASISWVVNLASLLGVGKSAPYGAGHFRVLPAFEH